jgi:hypothetical protein
LDSQARADLYYLYESGIMNSIFEAPRFFLPLPPLTPTHLFSDMAPLAAYKDFFMKVTNLTALAKDIPETVPLATKDDEIYRIFEKFPLPEQMSEDWEIFNRRMDILFGENVTSHKFISKTKQPARRPQIPQLHHQQQQVKQGTWQAFAMSESPKGSQWPLPRKTDSRQKLSNIWSSKGALGIYLIHWHGGK